MVEEEDSISRDALKIGGITLGIYVVVGVGIGLTGFVGIDWVNSATSSGGGSSFFGAFFVLSVFFTSIVIALFTGPILAGSTGVFAGLSLEDSRLAVLTSGLASFFGFYLMVGIAILIIITAAGGAMDTGGEDNTTGETYSDNSYQTTPTSSDDDSGGLVDTGRLLTSVVLAGFPTGIVGLSTAFLGNHLRP